MDTLAVVLEGPEKIAVRSLDLNPVHDDDIVVEVSWSGISTGTERLLWSGRMPQFPGMGYPLVPGYESVGHVIATGANAQHRLGEYVFLPGATCYKDARGLFGGAARTLIAPSARAIQIQERLGARGVLLALAATAHHAIAGGAPPDLIVGHGVLGRLLARITIAMGAPAPNVWEIDPQRRGSAFGYAVLDPEDDPRRDYKTIIDASGSSAVLDTLVMRLAKGGEIVLAGFYEERLSFAFVPTFMREARLRVAAEWKPEDLHATQALVRFGRLSLDELITHEHAPEDAADAYATAFADSACLKMVLDWRHCA
ncbi:MAG: chlorophyll synthesis pathway protein BchC [Hyphomonadaceae bacterium]